MSKYVLFSRPYEDEWKRIEYNNTDILEFLQNIVEGDIETLLLFNENVMIINRNGKVDNLTRNETATETAIIHSEIWDSIVGTAAIVKLNAEGNDFEAFDDAVDDYEKVREGVS